MDSLTHIAIGACIGEAFFEKGFGKKAMLWGIAAQSIPDIDFLAGLFLNTSENLLAHRGITHSILFAIFIVPVFALVANRVHRPQNIACSKWILFFAAQVFSHLFLDSFNNYGIGWFEPFISTRFSFNSVYVADPFFSLVPGVVFVLLLVLHSWHQYRKLLWKIGLFIPMIYLFYCLINKFSIDTDVKRALKIQNISYTNYFTTPAPLQNWLWYVVVTGNNGYYVGYRSVFDRKKEISFQYFPQNNYLLKAVKNKKEVQNLIQFSQDFYTLEKHNDTIVFNDLRFGQIVGWYNPKEKFAFHYYLQPVQNNKMVVQRGRFAKWNDASAERFWTRIKGN